MKRLHWLSLFGVAVFGVGVYVVMKDTHPDHLKYGAGLIGLGAFLVSPQTIMAAVDKALQWKKGA